MKSSTWHTHLPYRPYRSNPSPVTSEQQESMSTPNRVSVRVLYKNTRESQAEAIQQEFHGCSERGIPMPFFLEHVFKLSQDTIAKIQSGRWSLNAANVKAYKANCLAKGGREVKLYPKFATLADQALRAACKSVTGEAIPATPSAPYSRIYERGGTEVLESDATQRKPDAWKYLRSLSSNEVPVWALVQNPFEFKKAETRSTEVSDLVVTQPRSEAIAAAHFFSTPPGRQQRHQSIAALQAHQGLCSAHATSSGLSFNATASTSTIVNNPSLGGVTLKRPADDDDDDDSAGGRSKRPRVNPPMTQAECQLVDYMAECLTSTNRFFNVGFALDGSGMTVTYADRSVKLRSESFNFLQDSKLFATVMYGIHISNRRQAGFNPFLHTESALSHLSDDTGAWKEVEVENLVGSFYNFPVKVSQPSPGIAKAPTSFWCFEIIRIILFSRGITGRVTAVYETRATSPDGIVLILALKTSWQIDDPARKSEASIIEHLVAEIPDFKKHLPKVHFCDGYKASELDLPALSMPLNLSRLNTFYLRDFHIIASDMYIKLIDLKTIAAFKNVWLDCVRCHHAAWSKGKVLHRDLSENNLMACKRIKEDGSEAYEGILNDWDMASHLDEKNQVPRSAAAHRTGTLPFMAIDLLAEGPLVQHTPRHTYRHDLESFFYILLWACLYYDLETGQFVVPKESDTSQSWRSDKTEPVRMFKVSLLKDEGFFRTNVLPYTREEWDDVATAWLIPLFEYFRDAFSEGRQKESLVLPRRAKQKPLAQTSSELENPKLDNLITYEGFMKAIGETL